MTVLLIALLALTAVSATAVVATGDPRRQALVLSGYGMVLALLFMVLQAPDVALSQIGVGTAIVPLMVLLAIRKTERRR